MKFAAYLRKSTESSDRQVLSIESQKSVLLRIAQENNLDVEIILEESKSAKKPGRKEFDKLIQLIDKGKIQGILCWKLDRLSRNPIDGGTISWFLQQGKIHMIRTHERSYLPSDNILMMSVELGMANQQIRDLSVNVKRGLRTKVEKGGCANKAPLGYLNDKATKEIVVDPERSKYIVRIFELHNTGNYGYRDIAKILQKEGFRSHSGNKIYKSKIQQIINNPVYCGFVKYQEIVNKGNHQPLITKAVFDYAQEVSFAKLHPRKKNQFFPLRGFIRCDSCGCMYTATKKKGHDYYYCTNGKGICAGHRKYVRENDLYKEVAKILEKVPFDEELVDIMYESAKQRYKTMSGYQSKSLETLNNDLATLKTRESRLLDALLDLTISKEDFEAKNSELRKKIVYTETDIAELKAKSENLSATLEPTKNFFLDCITKQKKFLDAEPEEKQQTVSDVLWNLSMYEEKVLDYKLKSPYDILARTPKNASIDVLLGYKDSNLN